jgi:hypothetical protein
MLTIARPRQQEQQQQQELSQQQQQEQSQQSQLLIPPPVDFQRLLLQLLDVNSAEFELGNDGDEFEEQLLEKLLLSWAPPDALRLDPWYLFPRLHNLWSCYKLLAKCSRSCAEAMTTDRSCVGAMMTDSSAMHVGAGAGKKLYHELLRCSHDLVVLMVAQGWTRVTMETLPTGVLVWRCGKSCPALRVISEGVLFTPHTTPLLMHKSEN